MSMPRTHRAIAATGVALALAVALTGCVNPIEDMVQRGVEDAVEGAVEGATGGDVSIGGELPADFPEEIPLIEGEVLFAAGSGTGDEGWLVTIRSDAADPIADAVAELEAAGFAEDLDLGGVQVEGVAIRSNGTYAVWVAGDTEGVAYTVTRVQ